MSVWCGVGASPVAILYCVGNRPVCTGGCAPWCACAPSPVSPTAAVYLDRPTPSSPPTTLTEPHIHSPPQMPKQQVLVPVLRYVASARLSLPPAWAAAVLMSLETGLAAEVAQQQQQQQRATAHGQRSARWHPAGLLSALLRLQLAPSGTLLELLRDCVNAAGMQAAGPAVAGDRNGVAAALLLRLEARCAQQQQQQQLPNGSGPMGRLAQQAAAEMQPRGGGEGRVGTEDSDPDPAWMGEPVAATAATAAEVARW